jgi:hypothetical protein
MSRRRDAISAALLLAVFAGAGLLALDFAPTARRLPLLAASAGALLCAVQLRREMRRERAAADVEGSARIVEEWKLLGWFGALVGAVLAVGFDLGAPVFVFGFARVRAGWSLAASAALAALAFVVVHGVFGTLLQVPLFRGFLLGAVA